METTVLIVDDIMVNRLLLVELIKKLGYKHCEADNGKKAIEQLESRNIDIILMDIEMPVMNGLETTKHIRTKGTGNKKNVPIVALTAHNPMDYFEEFESAGFNELITKPYVLSKISAVIEKLCLLK